jgi:lipoprotein-releasing system permease protein
VYRPFELYVGLRYLRASRGGGFVSFISLISIVGIALGVAVLIVVLSVMNGFEKELRERILGLASHASITGFDGPLAEWRLVRDVAQANPQVTAAAPYVEGQGLMLADAKSPKGVLIRGVLPGEEGRVADVARFMQRGKLEDLEAGGYRVVLGSVLAQALGVDVGDEVLLIVSQANVTPVGLMPRNRHFTVSGIFSAGMYEFDSGLVFMHMSDAQALMRLGNAATGVRLRLATSTTRRRSRARLRSISAAASTSRTGRGATRTSSAPSSSRRRSCSSSCCWSSVSRPSTSSRRSS